jgi:hypothetical protein
MAEKKIRSNLDITNDTGKTPVHMAVFAYLPDVVIELAKLDDFSDKVDSVYLHSGTEVLAKQNGGSMWVSGKIDHVNSDGSYCVEFSDGDKEDRVSACNVLAADDLPYEIDLSKSNTHDHVLKWNESVYQGNYSCDLCEERGDGIAYHCDECNFDLHPVCALDRPENYPDEYNLEGTAINKSVKVIKSTEGDYFSCSKCGEFTNEAHYIHVEKDGTADDESETRSHLRCVFSIQELLMTKLKTKREGHTALEYALIVNLPTAIETLLKKTKTVMKNSDMKKR